MFRTSLMRLSRAARPALVRQQLPVIQNQIRMFSAAKEKLSKALESEIEYEVENYKQIEDIPEYLEESGFQLTSNINNLDIKITKTVGEKTIDIYFQARQPLADDEDMHQEDEEEEPLSDNYCEFTAVVYNNGANSGLVADCISMDTEIQIHQVGYFQDLRKVVSMQKFKRQLENYNGPGFDTLDERIQRSMMEMFTALGVDEHLGAFLEVMSLDKD